MTNLESDLVAPPLVDIPDPYDLDAPPEDDGMPAGRNAFDDVPASMVPPAAPPAEISIPDPTSNSGVERAVLAALFEADTDSTALILSRVTVDDLYLGNHQMLFAAISTLIQRGDPVSVLTVEHELRGLGAHSSVTNLAWLYELSREAPPTAEVPVLVRLLAEYSDQRQFRTSLIAAQSDLNSGMRAQDLAARHRHRLDQMERTDSDTIASIGDLVFSELESVDQRATDPASEDMILSGHSELDRVIGGFRAPDVVVPIAPPGAGKSLIVTDWFRHATIRQGKTAIMFALEMSKPQMTRRILAAEAKVLHTRLEHHPDQLDDDDWERIARRLSSISEAKMFICDDPELTIATIDAHCTAVKRKHGLDVVIVDHQGLVSSDGENRNIQVTKISWGLKMIAKKHNVVVVAPAQLNQQMAQREDKRPRTTDIRDSKAIEQNADIIIGLHREEIYNPDAATGEIEFAVLKHRSGKSGITVNAAWQPHYSRAVDLYRDPDTPDEPWAR